MLESDRLLYQRLETYMKVVHFNLKIAKEAEQAIKKLGIYPLTDQSLITLSFEQRTLIDALLYRFLMCQDYMGSKLFPLLARIIINDEATRLTWLDTLALMEKHNIISLENDWEELRKLRNLICHEYEALPDMRATDLNRLIAILPVFYKQIYLVDSYAQKILKSLHPL